MPIEGFNVDEFSKELAQQAVQLVPEDMSQEYREYIINKVYQFCVLSGNALSQDPNINMSVEQGQGIVQCIGEWTFHKSIDLIKSEVPNEFWDPILQKVAFIIFEAGKHAVTNNMSQDKSRAFIEEQVTKTFKEALEELIQGGKIDKKIAGSAVQQSNIDKMVEDGAVEVPKENQNKNMKLAAFALMLQSKSKDEVQLILEQMDEEEVNVITNYMKMPDLKEKVDPKLVAKYMNELAKMLEYINDSAPDTDDLLDMEDSIYIEQIKDLNKLYSASEIEHVVRFERPKVHKYINFCVRENFEKFSNFQVSVHLEKVIYEYIKSKLTA